ncbi:MAG: 30S ribosomal protein S3 [bacterium]|nr:30S ribosomal protein S3 [bacterium]
MSHKSHPKGLRIGVSTTWPSLWFADRPAQYRAQLKQDTELRQFIRQQLRSGMVHRVDMTRTPRELTFTIHTARPAVVIGRGGSGIEALRLELRRRVGTGVDVRVNVVEIKRPDRDAGTVALSVTDQIERRIPYRRILKQTLNRIMQSGAKGGRVMMKGRLGGKEISRTEWLSEGTIPLHTFRAAVDYGEAVARTTTGTIGIKVWIYSGEEE